MAAVEIGIHPGDVVALVAPDGTRRRYICSTLSGHGKVIYELSNHLEGSQVYDRMLDEHTVVVLNWIDQRVWD